MMTMMWKGRGGGGYVDVEGVCISARDREMLLSGGRYKKEQTRARGGEG